MLSSSTASSRSTLTGSTLSTSFGGSTWTSFLLWDIEKEFQNALASYEPWLAKNQPRRSMWESIIKNNQDDALEKSLRLGSRIRKTIKVGQRKLGAKFDKGDTPCHTTLSAQLLRLQHEVCTPLLHSSHSRYPYPLTRDQILRAAKGIRRACLAALQDQIARLSNKPTLPLLPPPRFSVPFCPLALQLQKGHESSSVSQLQTRKAHPKDRYDESEICPHCNVCISVSAHSGLPQYHRILFQAHTLPAELKMKHKLKYNLKQYERAKFACTSCYKVFDDSYAFLEHVFQRKIGSESSCLKRWSTEFGVESDLFERSPAAVEQCLKNCLDREMVRAKRMGKWRGETVKVLVQDT